MTFFIHIIPEWIELVSLTVCIGALVCRLWIIPPSGVRSAEQDKIISLVRRMLVFGIAVMIISSSFDLLLRAAEMTGRPLSLVFSALPTVFFHTHIGQAWLVRISALILSSIMMAASNKYRYSRGFQALLLCIFVLIAMSESASGHASDKGDFSFPEITDFLHLFAASVWGGGLLVISIAVLPKLARHGDESARFTAESAKRFSRIAGIAVGVIALTSLYNAWAYVGSFAALGKTPYGWTILAKTFLFLLLINLGAYNRFISVPLLLKWSGASPTVKKTPPRSEILFFSTFVRDHDGQRAASRFQRIVRIEALLILGVLLCAAILRHEIPAQHALHHGNGQEGAFPHHVGH